MPEPSATGGCSVSPEALHAKRPNQDFAACEPAAPDSDMRDITQNIQPCGSVLGVAHVFGSSVSWIEIHLFHIGLLAAQVSSEKSTCFQSSGRGRSDSCSYENRDAQQGADLQAQFLVVEAQ